MAAESSSSSSPSGIASTSSGHSPFKEDTSSPLKVAHNDEQLYNHYINVVSRIRTNTPEKHGLHHWDLAIRRFSQAHDYLYFIVLAFSALHLATTSEEPGFRQAFLDVALQHQNSSLQRFRLILNDVNADNCEPALTCAALTIACSLAVPLATPTAPTNHMEQLKRVMALFDGIVKLYRMGWTSTLDPNISPYIRSRVVALWSAEKPAPEAEASLDLLAQNAVLPLESADARDMYLLTIEKMKRTHRRLVDIPDDMEVVLFWPGMVSTKYFQALEAQEPIALVILSHWAVTLCYCSLYFWVGDGESNWGRWTITTVSKMLGDAWRPFLAWPLSQTAEIP